MGPTMEPCGTPDMIVSKSLVTLLMQNIVPTTSWFSFSSDESCC